MKICIERFSSNQVSMLNLRGHFLASEVVRFLSRLHAAGRSGLQEVLSCDTVQEIDVSVV
jgi:hypothetical protein